MSLKVWLFLHGHLILGISIGVIVVSMIFFARFSDAKKTWIAGGTAVLATLMCFAVGVPYTQAPQKSLLSHFGHETVICPYRYSFDLDGAKYQLRPGNKTQTVTDDPIKETRLSDHTGTELIGKQWIADQNATKNERKLIEQQPITWYKVTYEIGYHGVSKR